MILVSSIKGDGQLEIISLNIMKNMTYNMQYYL